MVYIKNIIKNNLNKKKLKKNTAKTQTNIMISLQARST